MKKYNNYIAALKTLDKYCQFDFDKYTEDEKEIMLVGFLNHFEKTFELSWKLSKTILEYEGVSEAVSGSPLTILKSARQYALIKDENTWKEALTDRNTLAHRYDSSVIEAMADKIKNVYLGMFYDLAHTCDKRIVSLVNDNLIPKSEIDTTIERIVSANAYALDLTESEGLKR